ncbi:uncharacterized protein LOC119652019 [Hermetia illucens]|uniref:uncharacterized protein LOC119652019 n=1 Tax=Hermetia illucens TaxID=343691 RepID=UPI0018CC1AD2|nr:uncharacterized protein LOC119652019 [Hermetia illucens]
MIQGREPIAKCIYFGKPIEKDDNNAEKLINKSKLKNIERQTRAFYKDITNFGGKEEVADELLKYNPSGTFTTSAPPTHVPCGSYILPNHGYVEPDINLDYLDHYLSADYESKADAIFVKKMEKLSQRIEEVNRSFEGLEEKLQKCLSSREKEILSQTMLHEEALNNCEEVRKLEAELSQIRNEACDFSQPEGATVGSFCCKIEIKRIIKLQRKVDKVRSLSLLRRCDLQNCEHGKGELRNEITQLKYDIKDAAEILRQYEKEVEALQASIAKDDKWLNWRKPVEEKLESTKFADPKVSGLISLQSKVSGCMENERKERMEIESELKLDSPNNANILGQGVSYQHPDLGKKYLKKTSSEISTPAISVRNRSENITKLDSSIHSSESPEILVEKQLEPSSDGNFFKQYAESSANRGLNTLSSSSLKQYLNDSSKSGNHTESSATNSTGYLLCRTPDYERGKQKKEKLDKHGNEKQIQISPKRSGQKLDEQSELREKIGPCSASSLSDGFARNASENFGKNNGLRSNKCQVVKPDLEPKSKSASCPAVKEKEMPTGRLDIQNKNPELGKRSKPDAAKTETSPKKKESSKCKCRCKYGEFIGRTSKVAPKEKSPNTTSTSSELDDEQTCDSPLDQIYPTKHKRDDFQDPPAGGASGGNDKLGRHDDKSHSTRQEKKEEPIGRGRYRGTNYGSGRHHGESIKAIHLNRPVGRNAGVLNIKKDVSNEGVELARDDTNTEIQIPLLEDHSPLKKETSQIAMRLQTAVAEVAKEIFNKVQEYIRKGGNRRKYTQNGKNNVLSKIINLDYSMSGLEDKFNLSQEGKKPFEVDGHLKASDYHSKLDNMRQHIQHDECEVDVGKNKNDCEMIMKEHRWADTILNEIIALRESNTTLQEKIEEIIKQNAFENDLKKQGVQSDFSSEESKVSLNSAIQKLNLCGLKFDNNKRKLRVTEDEKNETYSGDIGKPIPEFVPFEFQMIPSCHEHLSKFIQNENQVIESSEREISEMFLCQNNQKNWRDLHNERMTRTQVEISTQMYQADCQQSFQSLNGMDSMQIMKQFGPTWKTGKNKDDFSLPNHGWNGESEIESTQVQIKQLMKKIENQASLIRYYERAARRVDGNRYETLKKLESSREITSLCKEADISDPDHIRQKNQLKKEEVNNNMLPKSEGHQIMMETGEGNDLLESVIGITESNLASELGVRDIESISSTLEPQNELLVDQINKQSDMSNDQIIEKKESTAQWPTENKDTLWNENSVKSQNLGIEYNSRVQSLETAEKHQDLKEQVNRFSAKNNVHDIKVKHPGKVEDQPTPTTPKQYKNCMFPCNEKNICLTSVTLNNMIENRSKHVRWDLPNSSSKSVRVKVKSVATQFQVKEHVCNIRECKLLLNFLQKEIYKNLNTIYTKVDRKYIRKELDDIREALEWAKHKVSIISMCNCKNDIYSGISPNKATPLLQKICGKVMMEGVQALKCKELIYLHNIVYKAGVDCVRQMKRKQNTRSEKAPNLSFGAKMRSLENDIDVTRGYIEKYRKFSRI